MANLGYLDHGIARRRTLGDHILSETYAFSGIPVSLRVVENDPLLYGCGVLPQLASQVAVDMPRINEHHVHPTVWNLELGTILLNEPVVNAHGGGRLLGLCDVGTRFDVHAVQCGILAPAASQSQEQRPR